MSEQKIVKFFRAVVRNINEEEHTAEVVISGEQLDRYKERVMTSAFKKAIPEFMKHAVMLSSHAYRGLLNQIGEYTSIKIDSKNKEIVAKPKWYVGEGNPEADWGWKLAQKGMAAFSISFIPLKYKSYSSEEMDESGGSYRDYLEIDLLEASQVLVPAYAPALQRDLNSSEDEDMKKYYEEVLLVMAKDLKQEEKGVIPYSKESLAPKADPWNAGPEVKAASVDDLKRMCTWFGGDGTKKGDYKLPHHLQKGFSTVWRGVANAAARLPNTQIPDPDKKGCQGHLAKHYNEFKETPPWQDAGGKQWEEYCKLYAEIEKAGIEGTTVSDDILEQFKELVTSMFPIIANEWESFFKGDVVEEEAAPEEEVVEDRGWEETANEIRHRLQDPAQFSAFRYGSLKKDKPRVFAIYGKKKSDEKWAIQALRFPKADGWTMSSAKEWMKAHSDIGKDFEWPDYIADFDDAEKAMEFEFDPAASLTLFFRKGLVEDVLTTMKEFIVFVKTLEAKMNETTELSPLPVSFVDKKGSEGEKVLDTDKEQGDNQSEEDVELKETLSEEKLAEMRAILMGTDSNSDSKKIRKMFDDLVVELSEKFSDQSKRQ